MKGIILSTLVSVGMLIGANVYADDCKKADTSIEKPSNLSSQVVSSKDKELKSESELKSEEAPKRPFHAIGHSEGGP